MIGSNRSDGDGDKEDADTSALADVLQRQGGLTYGEPMDFSGAGKAWMQIVAVLTDSAN